MRHAILTAMSVLLCAVVIGGLSLTHGGRPSVGSLIDPWNGLYSSARLSRYSPLEVVELSGLDSTVRVYRDRRGVPHVFTASDHDAVVALGYVTAQDRLFQMDFIPRVAAGRLSEVVGGGALRTDRFMRSIGMDWGAKRNARRIQKSGGIESDLASWYCAGVNAYIGSLRTRDLPLEFRLLGYEPEACSVMQIARVLQFMSYDLTFRTDDARYSLLLAELDPADYEQLFPTHAPINEPIIPAEHHRARRAGGRIPESDGSTPMAGLLNALLSDHAAARAFTGFGFEHGKGSNNWAVAGSRSATGSPVLAGDMHLQVSLPSIWYEVHLVTPTMNVYGVTIPGSPLPIEAFNDHVAWAFTNTGSDQIDHVALSVTENGDGYRVDGESRAFTRIVDTILVRGAEPVVDTLLYSAWGPVRREREGALAIRWVAHDSSRSLKAIWSMLHAKSVDEFERGLRFWDSPMQNVLAADVDGNISIRSTGSLPVRRSGEGPGLLDGTRAGPVWRGRVPFDELPYSRNPSQGYLASANQEPAGSWYPHYLGHDWRRSYRAVRINQLLREKPIHSVEDLARYQSDVLATQGSDFVQLLDSVRCASQAAEDVRGRLASWDGMTTIEDDLTLAFDEWMSALNRLAWDEEPFRILRPYTSQLYRLLTGSIDAKWADIASTDTREGVNELICSALTEAHQALMQYSTTAWGDHHQVVFQHLLGSGMKPLSRGPYPFPGYFETLSPGSGRSVTHTASWRVVVDLSTRPPTGYGVYAGGASGNPLHEMYDAHVSTFLDFDYYQLENPSDPAHFEGAASIARLILNPIMP